jgi:hypothetical protein
MANVDFVHTVELVEELIGGFGLNPKELRLEGGPDVAVWNLQRGSATVLLIVREADEGAFIQVVSPILEVPEANREAFYERLLRLNMEELVNCAFALQENEVTVTSDRSAKNLNYSEVEEMLTNVAAYADEYDDRLSQEFGARRLGSEAD